MKVDADATAHLVELSIILHLFAKIMWKCIEIGIRNQLQINHKLNLPNDAPSLPFDVAIYWCVETNIERGKGGSKCFNKLYRSVTREIHTVNVSIMSPVDLRFISLGSPSKLSMDWAVSVLSITGLVHKNYKYDMVSDFSGF